MDVEKLVEDAREVGNFLGPVNGGETLLAMADALEALNRENKEPAKVRDYSTISSAIRERDAVIKQLTRENKELTELVERIGRMAATDDVRAWDSHQGLIDLLIIDRAVSS